MKHEVTIQVTISKTYLVSASNSDEAAEAALDLFHSDVPLEGEDLATVDIGITRPDPAYWAERGIRI